MYYVEGAGASQMMLSDMGMMQSQMMMTPVTRLCRGLELGRHYPTGSPVRLPPRYRLMPSQKSDHPAAEMILKALEPAPMSASRDKQPRKQRNENSWSYHYRQSKRIVSQPSAQTRSYGQSRSGGQICRRLRWRTNEEREATCGFVEAARSQAEHQ